MNTPGKQLGSIAFKKKPPEAGGWWGVQRVVRSDLSTAGEA
jgi:hypothetical protein